MKPFVYFIATAALCGVFALSAWYELQGKSTSLLVILSYGILLGFLCSTSGLVILTLRKKIARGIYYFLAGIVVAALLLASFISADLLFGPGSSKQMGIFSVIIVVSWTLTLLSPVTAQRKQPNQAPEPTAAAGRGSS